jgi:hypothetical protein
VVLKASEKINMAFYQLTPFKSSPQLMIQGVVSYLFGKFAQDIAPTQGYVLSDSAATTTATVTVKITQGNVPLPGSLITIVGSANSSGIFNVTNAVILTVSAAQVPDAGVYTLTYAIASTTQATTADGGLFYIPQPEIGDTLTAGIVAALPASSAPVTSPVGAPNSIGKSLSATVTLPASSAAIPSTLSGVTVNLQGSNVDRDDHYSTVATIGTGIAAGTTVDWQSGQGVPTAPSDSLAVGNVNLPNFLFYRFQVTAAVGAGPIVATLLQ